MTAEDARLLAAVFAESESVLMEALPDGRFSLLSDASHWFSRRFDAPQRGDVLDIVGAYPVLDHFLVDARDHWQYGASGVAVRSGVWVESDGDEEVPLEATARTVSDRPMLVLERPVSRYRDEVRIAQRARDSLLDGEHLERAVAERTEMIREREREIAVRLVSAAEFRDSTTGDHIKRIGASSLLLGQSIGLSDDILRHLELAAAMHDVGKIGVPDGILLKPGPLDPDERRVMESHTVKGADILEGSQVPALQLAQTIALSHHEKWDGSGYPHGLVGDAIPLVARVVAVVDYYDACSHDRPYRTAMPMTAVIETMRAERGRHFDPEVLDAFLTLHAEVMRISQEVAAETVLDFGSDVEPHGP